MRSSLRSQLKALNPAGAGPPSLRAVTRGRQLQFPTGFREIVDLLQPVKITSALNSGTCSGSCEITITPDGVVHFTGRVHDSGALGVSYQVMVVLHVLFSDEIQDAYFPHSGRAGGTFSFSDRDDTWDKQRTSTILAEQWAKVKTAAASPRTVFSTDNSQFHLIQAFATATTGLFLFNL